MLGAAPNTASPPVRFSRGSLCGLGDEAGCSLDAQIAAHTTLGWSQVELRSIDGCRLARLDDAAVSRMADSLGEAGMRTPVLASAIGDWSVTIARDFAYDLEELARLLAVAERLDASFIRIMSYPSGDATEADWETEALRRVAELASRAADRGVELLHENCHGWAARDPARALRLIDATGGRGLRLLFDVGNPVAHGYDGHDYLLRTLPWTAHIHVKDAVVLRDGEVRFTTPGDGEARLLECLDAALGTGYAGALSIEPHVAVRPHDGMRRAEVDLTEAYVAYGRKFMKFLGNRLSRERGAP